MDGQNLTNKDTLKKSIISTFIIALTFVSLDVTGQEKHGYFHYDKIFQNFDLKEQSDKFLSAFLKNLNDSLFILQGNFESYYKTGIPHNSKIDSAKKKEIEATIQKLSKSIEDFQKSAEERYTKELKEIQSQIRNKIYISIEQFCKKNNIRSLADKEAIVYCTDCIDYTDEIIKFFADSKKRE